MECNKKCTSKDLYVFSWFPAEDERVLYGPYKNQNSTLKLILVQRLNDLNTKAKWLMDNT